jgi:hypothetical protein
MELHCLPQGRGQWSAHCTHQLSRRRESVHIGTSENMGLSGVSAALLSICKIIKYALIATIKLRGMFAVDPREPARRRCANRPTVPVGRVRPSDTKDYRPGRATIASPD